MEEICLFFQAVRFKDDTGKSCCRSGKVVLAPLGDLSQEFKELFENHPFWSKAGPTITCLHLFSCSYLLYNGRIAEKMANARE